METHIWLLIMWFCVGLTAGVIGIWTNRLAFTISAVIFPTILGPFFPCLWAADWWEHRDMRRLSAMAKKRRYEFLKES